MCERSFLILSVYWLFMWNAHCRLPIHKFTRQNTGAAIPLQKCIYFLPEVVFTASAGVNTAMLVWENRPTTLTGGDGVTLPHPNCVQNWEDNMQTWPSVTYSKICSYIMDSMAIDSKAMDNLKASEAYQYLHSSKVNRVMSYKHNFRLSESNGRA